MAYPHARLGITLRESTASPASRTDVPRTTYRPLAISLLLAAAAISGCVSQEAHAGGDPVEREFRLLGPKIVQAIRDRDVDLLLGLSPADLADAARGDMAPGTPLYCSVFEKSCAESKHSVFDLVTSARRLVVKVNVAKPWSRDPRFRIEDDRLAWRRGLLTLFDATVVNERRIADGAYFCERWGRDIFIWTFDYLREGWRSTFGVFDNGTHISGAD